MLTDEQIDAVITAGVKSGAISWLGFKKGDVGRFTLGVISASDRQQARAIEAEVRKQDEALIRQLADSLAGYRRNHNDGQPCDAEKAARARLGEKEGERDG